MNTAITTWIRSWQTLVGRVERITAMPFHKVSDEQMEVVCTFDDTCHILVIEILKQSRAIFWSGVASQRAN